MRHNTDRILVSHAGNLPRPGDIDELVDGGQRLDAATGEAYRERLPEAVQRIVDLQIELGVDIVNDGEYAKAGSYGGYMQQRVSGYTTLPLDASRPPKRGGTAERDRLEFLACISRACGSPAPAARCGLDSQRQARCARRRSGSAMGQ